MARVHHSDSTAPAPTATRNQRSRVRHRRPCASTRPAGRRPLPSRPFHRSEVFLRTVALRSAVTLNRHARNPLLGPADGPRDRIGESRLLPPHLRPKGRAASMPSRQRRRQLARTRVARGRQPQRGPGRVSNLVPDALGSPDTAPARPPGERHAGSDVRAWFPSAAPSSA